MQHGNVETWPHWARLSLSATEVVFTGTLRWAGAIRLDSQLHPVCYLDERLVSGFPSALLEARNHIRPVRALIAPLKQG